MDDAFWKKYYLSSLGATKNDSEARLKKKMEYLEQIVQRQILFNIQEENR